MNHVPVSVGGPATAATRLFVESGVTYLTIVSKLCLEMVHEGLARPTTPRPISVVDRPLDGSASLEEANEIAPFVPGVDVLLTGNARAPGKKPVTSLAVRLAVLGSLPSTARALDTEPEIELLVDKTVHVYGDRKTEASHPETFISLPVVYERAAADEDNPVGRGTTRAPNLILPENELGAAAFGPLNPEWRIRKRELESGEMRDQGDHLFLSDAFPFEYFHLAPLEQRLPTGSEIDWIFVEGMSSEVERFATKLPKARAMIELHRAGEAPRTFETTCDTVSIDMDLHQVSLLFRGHVEVTEEELTGLHVNVAFTVSDEDEEEKKNEEEKDEGPTTARGPDTEAPPPLLAAALPPVPSLVATLPPPGAPPTPPPAPPPPAPPPSMHDEEDDHEPNTNVKNALDRASANLAEELTPPVHAPPGSAITEPPPPATDPPLGFPSLSAGALRPSGVPRMDLAAPLGDLTTAEPFPAGSFSAAFAGASVEESFVDEAPEVRPASMAPALVQPRAPRLTLHTIPPPGGSSPASAMPFAPKPLDQPRPPRDEVDLSAALPFSRTGAQVSGKSLFESMSSSSPSLPAVPEIVPPIEPPAVVEIAASEEFTVHAKTAPPPAWLDEASMEGPPPAPLPFVRSMQGPALPVFPKAPAIPNLDAPSTGSNVASVPPALFGGGLGVKPLSPQDLPRPRALPKLHDDDVEEPEPTRRSSFPPRPGKDRPALSTAAVAARSRTSAPPPPAPTRKSVADPVPPPVAVVMVEDTSPRGVVLATLAKKEAFYNASFPGADLSGIDFSKAVLSGINLAGANLERCNFDGARLTAAKLNGARLANATLIDADLAEADLSKANLESARFDKAKLSDANLGLAEARNASFEGVSGPRANFTQAKLQGASLKDAVFSSADFSRAEIEGANFSGTELGSAKFVDARASNSDFTSGFLDHTVFTGAAMTKVNFDGASLPSSNWERASLESCSFVGCKMGKAVFTRSILNQSIFDRADLEGANLLGATGASASFVETILTSADFRQTKLSDAKLEKVDARKLNAQKAVLLGARWVGANLTGANLRSVKMKGASLEGADVTDADLRDVDLENGDVRVKTKAGVKIGGAILKGAIGADELTDKG